jgi:hypothetical protein
MSVSKREGIEQDFYYALKKLYQIERLKELEGPEPIIAQLVEQLGRFQRKLGDAAWEQVQKQYPEFRENMRALEATEREWDQKCLNCAHWDASLAEPDSTRWCARYERENITKPEPCPSHVLRVLN